VEESFIDDFSFWISDFGLSRYYEDNYQPHANVPIPVRWSAPEVLRQKDITSKSDVFSFGICMWEILQKGQRKRSTFEVYFLSFLIDHPLPQNLGLGKRMLRLLKL